MTDITISLLAKLTEVFEGRTFDRTVELRDYLRVTEGLNGTILAIRKVLIDGESKWDQLTNQDRDIIRELKDAVYDADDNLDEFLTLVKTMQPLSQPRKLYKFSKKKARELTDIQKKFDVIRFNYRFFMLYINDDPIKVTRDKISSYVDANDVIIGRDKDKDAILNTMLLHEPFVNHNRVGFYSIVGDRGLGKTALAQFVFNDEMTRKKFPHRFWVSVSDLCREQFDSETILCKIQELATDLRKLSGMKYFLVLDDVWNENHEKWLKLKRNLMLGDHGSIVLVTTCSMRTATITGDTIDDTYALQPLSKEDSWRLFEMLAFTTGSEEENHNEFVEIGKNIVEQCYGNPLAIKVVANHLFVQPISMWQSFQRSGLTRFGEGDNGVLPILKLSYCSLEPLAQSCLRYCTIFPKGYTIHKEKMIGLWIAQGYVVPSHSDESIEDVAEEQLLNLLNKCFFEDLARDEYGDVESFKLHNLMHDVAQEVGQEEIRITTSNVNCLGKSIRHLNYVGDESLDISLYNKKIRSYISGCGPSIDAQIDNWMKLRVLDLSRCDVKHLPDSVGKLLHLRYLDLSHNKNLELLCDSITQLHNLQTLDLEKCEKLAFMPSGMYKLTNLRILPLFVVGNGISSVEQSLEGTFKDLEALSKIRGKICIKIGINCTTLEEDIGRRGKYLQHMLHLKEIKIEFKDGGTCAYDLETLFYMLQPHGDIKGIILHNYKGRSLGQWGNHRWNDNFPLLVRVVLWKCKNLEQMPVLSKLPSLKTLSLFCLDSLEYMENLQSTNRRGNEVVEFFPSLETLKIMWMKRLKGWWLQRGGVVEDRGVRLRFPRLLYLKIYKCPYLMSFAPCLRPEIKVEHELPRLCSLKIANCPNLALDLICPRVETFELRDIGERLQIILDDLQYTSNLRYAEVDNVRYLEQFVYSPLLRLCIHGDLELEIFPFINATSLRELEIRYCANLRDLSRLKYFSYLEELKLLGNNQLSISMFDSVPWGLFYNTLRYLKFDALPKMTSLPWSMEYFTSLQTLELRWCENLEELPQSMSRLSSLKNLSIIHCPRIRSLPKRMKDLTSLKALSIQNGCPELHRRCRKPDGEDFRKIQHIPHLSIGSTT